MRQRTRVLPKPTGDKYLTRMDYPDRGIVGYMLRCLMGREDGKGKLRKFFPVKRYGSMRSAKAAAVIARGKWYRRLPKHLKTLKVVATRTGKVSGKGVYLTTRISRSANGREQVYSHYVATWIDDNSKQRRKWFSLTKYGTDGAHKLALALRRKMVKGRPRA